MTFPGGKNRMATKLLIVATFLTIFASAEPAKAGLANGNSTTNAQNLYTFISGLNSKSSKRILSGQNILQETNTPTGITDENDLIWNLASQTGKVPAIVGADFNDTDTNQQISPELVTLAQKQGCIIEIDGGLTFPNQTSGESLDHLLPGGADNAAFITSMQALAAQLKYFQQNNITVLYRPLHEMNGSWASYYTTDTASFQALWQYLFTYFTQTEGLNNLIWVFAPNNSGDGVPSCEAYYPGSAYVDIVGADVYNDTATMAEYSYFTTLGKPIFYTEFGNGSGSGGGSYNGTYNFETQLIATIKSTYPNVVGFMAWSDWADSSVSGGWVYKSIEQNIEGGMMSDSWVLTASDLQSGGYGDPVSGLTGYYEIVNQSTGMALTLDSMTQGSASLSGATYGGNIYQMWSLAPDVSGGYTMTNLYSNQILYAPYPGTSGESVLQYGEASWLAGYREWNVTSNGNGTYTITNDLYPSICLTSSGTNVTASTSTGAASQQWILTPISPSTPSSTAIQWGTATNITTDTDVATNGTYVDAALLDTEANLGASSLNNFLTVNGVSFNIVANGTSDATDPSGDIELTSSRTVTSAGGDSPSGSAAYNTLVTHLEYASGTTTQTVTLNNLTVGHTYQVQIWSAYISGGTRPLDLSGTDGTDSITLEPGTGQFSIGTFTASATSLTFTATPTGTDGMLNAVSLRDITSSGTEGEIQWGSATNVSTDTDVSTNGTYVDAALLDTEANLGASSLSNFLTVNGVSFNIVANGTSGATDPSGDIELTSSRTVTSAGGDSPSGSAAYNTLVTHLEYASGSSSQTVTLNHLTVGHTYQVQIWSAYIEGGTRPLDLSGTSGTDSVTLEPGTGQFSIGTFTASATTLSFTATPTGTDGMLNAVSLRDTTP